MNCSPNLRKNTAASGDYCKPNSLSSSPTNGPSSIPRPLPEHSLTGAYFDSASQQCFSNSAPKNIIQLRRSSDPMSTISGQPFVLSYTTQNSPPDFDALDSNQLFMQESAEISPKYMSLESYSHHFYPHSDYPQQFNTAIQQLDKKVVLYKTEMCRTFEETGICKYGLKCQFAHDPAEIRLIPRHPRYKTEICKTFWQLGNCPYGKRCCFIHTENELRESNSSCFSSKKSLQKETLVENTTDDVYGSLDMMLSDESVIGRISSRNSTRSQSPKENFSACFSEIPFRNRRRKSIIEELSNLLSDNCSLNARSDPKAPSAQDPRVPFLQTKSFDLWRDENGREDDVAGSDGKHENSALSKLEGVEEFVVFNKSPGTRRPSIISKDIWSSQKQEVATGHNLIYSTGETETANTANVNNVIKQSSSGTSSNNSISSQSRNQILMDMIQLLDSEE